MFKHEAVTQGQKIFNEAACNEAARDEMQKRYLDPDRLRGRNE